MNKSLGKANRKSFAWGRWISLYCAVSFAVLGLDAAINHLSVLESNPFSFVPLIFTIPAIALSLAAVFSSRWRRLAWIIGLLGVSVGLAGTLFHNITTLLEAGDMGYIEALVYALRPPLAPFAFASTGVLMLLVTLAER